MFNLNVHLSSSRMFQFRSKWYFIDMQLFEVCTAYCSKYLQIIPKKKKIKQKQKVLMKIILHIYTWFNISKCTCWWNLFHWLYKWLKGQLIKMYHKQVQVIRNFLCELIKVCLWRSELHRTRTRYVSSLSKEHNRTTSTTAVSSWQKFILNLIYLLII